MSRTLPVPSVPAATSGPRTHIRERRRGCDDLRWPRHRERFLYETDPRRAAALDQAEVLAEVHDQIRDVGVDIRSEAVCDDDVGHDSLPALRLLEEEELLDQLLDQRVRLGARERPRRGAPSPSRFSRIHPVRSMLTAIARAGEAKSGGWHRSLDACRGDPPSKVPDRCGQPASGGRGRTLTRSHPQTREHLRQQLSTAGVRAVAVACQHDHRRVVAAGIEHRSDRLVEPRVDVADAPCSRGWSGSYSNSQKWCPTHWYSPNPQAKRSQRSRPRTSRRSAEPRFDTGDHVVEQVLEFRRGVPLCESDAAPSCGRFRDAFQSGCDSVASDDLVDEPLRLSGELEAVDDRGVRV